MRVARCRRRRAAGSRGLPTIATTPALDRTGERIEEALLQAAIYGGVSAFNVASEACAGQDAAEAGGRCPS
jgi:hypothetical protein